MKQDQSLFELANTKRDIGDQMAESSTQNRPHLMYVTFVPNLNFILLHQTQEKINVKKIS